MHCYGEEETTLLTELKFLYRVLAWLFLFSETELHANQITERKKKRKYVSWC